MVRTTFLFYTRYNYPVVAANYGILGMDYQLKKHIIKNSLKSIGAWIFGEYWVLRDEREACFYPTYPILDFTDFTTTKPNYHGSLPLISTKT